ncbi:MAG: radical SAM protein [Lachnospiraceae bacterium]|nr:radical SAM protein [Lachnospiraceae bacterium]MDY5521446.1 radical SAM protein [Agathobacter sp.]
MSITKEVLDSETQITSYQFTDIDAIMNEKWGGQWSEYREKWAASNDIQNEVSDFPLYILTELNSFCNLHCTMCKHAEDSSEMERKSMPIEMYEEIIKQCKEMGVPSINIGTGTECTLHPQIDRIMTDVKKSGAIDKFFLTNGSTLNARLIDLIFGGEFERVEISVDAATAETYEQIRRNGKYQRLEDNINQLIEKKRLRKSKLPIIRLSFCVQKDNIEEIDAFYDKWQNKVDVIEYQKMVSTAVDIQNQCSKRRCANPFNRLTIDYEGNIYPCCSILYQTEYCLGNIRDISLYDAWHGKKIESLRESFKRGKLFEHCNRCLLSIYGE